MTLSSLRVDGGASANDFLMQFQADISGSAVIRPECVESTAMGAAFLAGLNVGFWKDREELRSLQSAGREFLPSMEPEKRERLLRGWKRAVRCALAWAEDASED